MKLTISNAEFPDYVDVMLGNSGYTLLHKDELSNICTPELFSRLAVGVPIECILISKEQLESFINATKIATAFETILTE